MAEVKQSARNRAPYSIHALILFFGFLALLWIDRQRWFFVDDWIFFTHYDPVHQQAFTFSTPYNLHWEAAPYLFYNAMYAIVGLHSYLPYLAVGLSLHILAVNLLWRIMLVSGVEAWTATALSLLVAIFGAGWELLNWAIIISFSGPIALGLLALLVAYSDMKQVRRDLIMVICLTAGLMFSEIGALMVLPCSLVILFRRGWREMILVVATPLAAYGLWLVTQGAAAVSQTVTLYQSPHLNLASVPLYVLGGVAGSITAGFGLRHPGVSVTFDLVVGGGIAALLSRPLWQERKNFRQQLKHSLSAPVATAIAGMAFFAMVSIEHGSPETIFIGRYFYVGWFLMTPLLGVAISRYLGQNSRRRIIFLALTCACAASSTSLLVRATADYASLDSQTKGYVAAAAAIVRDNPASILLPSRVGLQPEFLADVTVDSLRKFLGDSALDLTPPPDPATATLAALVLQTSVSGNNLYAHSGSLRANIESKAASGCRSFATGKLAYLSVSGPQSILIEAAEPFMLTVSGTGESGEPAAEIHDQIPSGANYFNSTLTSTLGLSGSQALLVCPLP